MKRLVRSNGFTIVELLVVIVVIGILAVISVVAYNGIQSRARAAQMETDLVAIYKKILIDKELTSAYPATLAAANEGQGITASDGSVLQYTVDNLASPPTYCLTMFRGGEAYHVDQTGTVQAGACAGHSLAGTSPPAIAGYYDFSAFDTTNNMTVNPGAAIPDGSWMVVVVAFNNDVFPALPAGWTTLISRVTTGTLRTSVFGKIKTSADTFPIQVTMSSGGNTANGAILWGSGAAPVSSWILGNHFWRDGTSATQYITTTPTATTTSDQNLIISISTERTSAAESAVSSVTGATQWFFIPQIGSNKIQTITVSTAVKATAGTTTPVTVTYPNPQVLNGMSFQLALPPAS